MACSPERHLWKTLKWLRSIGCHEPLVALGVGNRPLPLGKLGSNEKEHVCVCECVCVPPCRPLEQWNPLAPAAELRVSSLMVRAGAPPWCLRPTAPLSLLLRFAWNPPSVSGLVIFLQPWKLIRGYLLLTSSCLQIATGAEGNSGSQTRLFLILCLPCAYSSSQSPRWNTGNTPCVWLSPFLTEVAWGVNLDTLESLGPPPGSSSHLSFLPPPSWAGRSGISFHLFFSLWRWVLSHSLFSTQPHGEWAVGEKMAHQ